MVVGPNPLADRIVQVRHQLGKLLFIQLFHSLDEFGHGLELRITYDRRQATTCLVKILLRVEKPVHSICELPEHFQFGQVLDHLLQVNLFGFREVLSSLHDQVTTLEDEVSFLLECQAPALLAPLDLARLRPRFFLRPALPRRLMSVRIRRTASRISLLMSLITWNTHN